jgi:hypothetical protein
MTTPPITNRESRDVMSSKTRTRTTATITDKSGSGSTLRSVPDQDTSATGRTDTEDKLWEALHANPNSTAVDLSGVAKIGKSTAQKILVKWAADGSVTRTSGIAEGGRRAADVWAITEIDAAPVGQADAALAEEDVDAAGTALTAPDGSDETDAEVITPDEGEATESANTKPTVVAADETDATGSAEAEPIIAQKTKTADDGAATDTDTAGGKPRLASGALRGMVEDCLRDHPGEQFGPTAIAKELGGKSSGAVSNALDKLVEDGVAVKTNDKPRRFALAPAEAAAVHVPTN